MLFASYVIGLWFTLRTHAAVIWNNEVEEKAKLHESGTLQANGSLSLHPSSSSAPHPAHKQTSQDSSRGSATRNVVRDTQLYKRILGQSLKQIGLSPSGDSRRASAQEHHPSSPQNIPHLVPPKTSGTDTTAEAGSLGTLHIEGLSDEQNHTLARQVAEMAATAATVAARDVTKAPKKVAAISHAPVPYNPPTRGPGSRAGTVLQADHDEGFGHELSGGGPQQASGGHDAPNWSRTKSAVILLGATLLYAVIAEILVNTVDVVLESVDIDEKFLGITLFALVPNTTEFLVGRALSLPRLVQGLLLTLIIIRTPSPSR